VAAAAVVVSQGLVTNTTAHGAIVLDSLLVRVYDNTGVPAAERSRALARAGGILASVGIEAAWLECPRHGTGRWRSVCDSPPAPAEIIVRLVHSSTEGTAHLARALGYSLVDGGTGRGTLATVFTDRVDTLAHRSRSDRAALLGRAIAHEIGHLILGTNEHSDRGLMRETWTFQEVQRNRPDDWRFTPAERDELQAARLAGAASVAEMRARNGAGSGAQNPRTLLNKRP
jgi:hypothetical protein